MKRLLVLALSALALTAQAETCENYIDQMYSDYTSFDGNEATNFLVKGTRITARGEHGYTSHAMDRNFSIDDSLASHYYENFNLEKEADNVIQGTFSDVFPGRSDDAIDHTSLKIYADTRVELVLHSWGNGRYELSDLQCFQGHYGNSFVITGQHRTWGFGLDVWTFLILPEYTTLT